MPTDQSRVEDAERRSAEAKRERTTALDRLAEDQATIARLTSELTKEKRHHELTRQQWREQVAELKASIDEKTSELAAAKEQPKAATASSREHLHKLLDELLDRRSDDDGREWGVLESSVMEFKVPRSTSAVEPKADAPKPIACAKCGATKNAWGLPFLANPSFWHDQEPGTHCKADHTTCLCHVLTTEESS